MTKKNINILNNIQKSGTKPHVSCLVLVLNSTVRRHMVTLNMRRRKRLSLKPNKPNPFTHRPVNRTRCP